MTPSTLSITVTLDSLQSALLITARLYHEMVQSHSNLIQYAQSLITSRDTPSYVSVVLRSGLKYDLSTELDVESVSDPVLKGLINRFLSAQRDLIKSRDIARSWAKYKGYIK